MALGIWLAEAGWLPDAIIRREMRRLCHDRLTTMPNAADLRDASRDAEIAIETEAANRQHYELPPQFFQRVLGPRLKYSCCWWDSSVCDLRQAEEAALALTCQRAEVEDGMRILELGCGWGSLTLWIAEHFPNCRVTAVSNAANQRNFIMQRAAERGCDHRIEVITADISDWNTTSQFDRVMSIEMFEHVRNHARLLHRIAGWLAPAGALFVHIFCHREGAYLFELDDGVDWMARHFFTGGMMPSFDWFDQFSQDLRIRQRWWVDGTHYQKTCNAWLANMDTRRAEVLESLVSTYGLKEVRLWYQRWRMFFMACAELFGINGGSEWAVGHYLFVRR